MKSGDKVNLTTASGEKHIGTVIKVGTNDTHTFTITRPGGSTQKFHNVSKLPDNKDKVKPQTAYWSTGTEKVQTDDSHKTKSTQKKQDY